ncbi:hypothetical protein ACFQY4_39625 [Catellatospora bangladeshensis]|uniref:hypothetical protein n=1 Tax=Catellatospora bangladeshensis TaxID=310355 RepID=UPI001942742F|nr:hypothetical protein [Catellatospora bangladeshensis]
MSSTAAPAAPADGDLLRHLASQNRRLLVAAWAVGGAGLIITAAVAGVPGPGWVWRTVSALAALATLVVYFGAVHLLWRVRRPAALAPVTLPQGFAAFTSPVVYARGTLALAGAGFALGGGQPLTASALVVLAALLIHHPPRLLVTPGGVSVRGLRTRTVPWARLTGVQVRPRGGVAELSLWTEPATGPSGVLRVTLPKFDVDREFLVRLLQHYRAVPEDRTAIGAPAELARRRAAVPPPSDELDEDLDDLLDGQP